jgi:hypothetical protein
MYKLTNRNRIFQRLLKHGSKYICALFETSAWQQPTVQPYKDQVCMCASSIQIFCYFQTMAENPDILPLDGFVLIFTMHNTLIHLGNFILSFLFHESTKIAQN